ncbi:MAG: hypothetical protein FJW88_01575 [Actinobacteria bacterium]|nr:hypothetical protein [Actinomycetota bacterium]
MPPEPEAPRWTSAARPLDPARIVRTLDRHGVAYVLIGGLAAVVHGYQGATFDADLVPALDEANLAGLAAALEELHATVFANPARTDLGVGGAPPEAADFAFDPQALRRHLDWHLSTDAGLVDVSLVVDRIGGFDELEAEATQVAVHGVQLRVASLDHLIESKAAAGRPKDLRALPELRALRDERGDR